MPYVSSGLTAGVRPNSEPVARLMTASRCLRRRLGTAGLFMALGLSAPATAGDAGGPVSMWADGESWRTRIVSAVTATGTRTTLPLGLQVDLAEGWHIYWRSPGEAGLPPSLSVEPGSENVASAEILWPAPRQSIEQGELVTRTYSGNVLLPVRLHLEQPGRPATLVAGIDYQVCDQVCIPVRVDTRLHLPAGTAAPSPAARLVAEAEARVPGRPEAAGFTRLDAGFDGTGTVRVTAESRLALDAAPAEIAALLEGPDGIFFRSGRATVSADRTVVSVDVAVLPPFDPERIAGADLGVTLVTGAANAYRHLVVGGPAPPGGGMTVGGAFLLALLGGLILNLMPCVLPVLGIKIARLIDAAGRDRAAVSVSFLATAAGIVASFGLLALLVAAVRAAGLTAGWGFQFQIPGFIAFLAVIVLLFAAVLAGVCEIRLPARVNRWLHRAGGDATGPVGAFAEGAFATVLATPCTAPVVGTTVGFALTRGFGDIALVFLGLGLGMAVPWLLVAARPGLLAVLPRPGPWMGRLKLVLALLLLGTAVWLLSVLHAAVGLLPTLMAAGLSGLAVLAFAARTPERAGLAMRAGGLAAVFLAVLVPALSERGLPGEAAGAGDPLWRPLDPTAVSGMAADQVVLVDVTAEWCVTCVVNKRLVLDRPPVRRLLETGEVVGLRGDWTLPDPAIAAYLANHQRLGIPFNAVYGPARPEGEGAAGAAAPEGGGRSRRTRQTGRGQVTCSSPLRGAIGSLAVARHHSNPGGSDSHFHW